jgi:hypothetical protein
MHRTGGGFFEGKVLPTDLFFSIAPIVLGAILPFSFFTSQTF